MHYRQIIEVELIGYVIVKCHVRSVLIVEHEIFLQSKPCSIHVVVGMQINLLIFDALPQLLHKYVITPASLAIHADLDIVILQQSGELAALISIKDFRFTMFGYGFLHGFNAEVGRQCVG